MIQLCLLQLKIIRNRIISMSVADEIKATILLFIMLMLFGGIYTGAWRLISYLNGVAIAGPLLVNKLLALVFLTSFSMVAFSGLITSFSTIFSSKDLPWLLSTPLRVRSIFAFKALATVFYASWMVLVALFPFLLALGVVKHAPLLFYVKITFLLVPFVSIAAFVGVLICLALMRFFPAHRTRDILLLLGVMFMTGLYVLFRFMQPERLVRPDGMQVVSQYLDYLNAPTAAYLPSWWVTAGVFGAVSGNAVAFWFNGFLLAGAAVLVFLFINAVASRFFFIGWAEGQVYHMRKKAAPHTYHHGSPIRALFRKDVLTFFRDTNEWSQLLILSSIVIVYLFSIYKLPLDSMYLQNFVSYVNVGLIGFILSAVGLRLVFPLVSLEGINLWLIRVSPLGMRRFLTEKLFFGAIPMVVAGLLLVTTSNLILKTDTVIFCAMLMTILLMSLGLSGMAMGFGALFPRFNMANVAQIESSAGGLFYILAALFYIGLNMSLLAMPMQNFYHMKFGGEGLAWHHFWWVGAGLLLVNGTAFLLPPLLGWNSLSKREQ